MPRYRLYAIFILLVLALYRPAYGEGVVEKSYLSPRSLAAKTLQIYLPPDNNTPAPLVVHVCGKDFDLPYPEKMTAFARSRGWILMKVRGLKGLHGYQLDELELQAAVRSVGEQFNVDPDRIYLLAWGVHGVLRSAYRSPGRYGAVASSSPYTDFSTYYRLFYGGVPTAPYQRAVIGNASTRKLIGNAEHLPTLLMMSDSDWVQKETKKMIALFEQSRKKSSNPGSYTYEIIRSADQVNKILAAYRFFEGKSRVKYPQHISLTSHTLRYNRAYWAEILELSSPYTPGTLEVSAAADTLRVRAEGIRAFRLNFTAEAALKLGWDPNRPVKIIINNNHIASNPARPITYRFDKEKKTWIERQKEFEGGELKKTPENPGWISPLLPFVITYGTAGTPAESRKNRETAEFLSKSYNKFFGSVISPVPDSYYDSARLGDITKNLVLIGSSDSHSLFKELKLPFQISRERIKILNKTYPADSPVAVIYPNPLKTSRSLMFINNLGPGLEPWPYSWEAAGWAWPDYVIFRHSGKTATQAGLYDSVAEGGFFSDNWNADLIKKPVEKEEDITPPWVEEWTPAPDEGDVERQPQIVVRLRDAQSGVDSESISMFINDREVTPGISGTPGLFILTYTPGYEFPYGKKIRLEVAAQDLVSNEMWEEITFTIKPEWLYQLRVNCGGAEWTDPNGHIWQADKKYEEDSWGYSRGRVYINKQKKLIKDTNLGPIYRAERWGLKNYRFNLENRTYRIRMHFAEVYFREVGRRVFNISVEGKRLVKDFDIFAEAGYGVATTLGVVTEVSDGKLNIRFRSSKNYAKISGIEIISVGSDNIGDVTPPEVSGWNPWNGARKVPAEAAVLVSVTDDETGVDINSINMMVDGYEVKPDISGNSFRYNLYWVPQEHFEYGKNVTVVIGVSDMAEFPNRVNAINTFTIEPAPPPEE